MSKQNSAVPRQRLERRIKVGDRVRFRFGNHMVLGTVIEDRGSIGVGGRLLLGIRVILGEEERILELPAEEVKVA